MTTKKWTALGVISTIIIALITWVLTAFQPPAQEINTVSISGVNNGIVAGRIEITDAPQRHLDQKLLDYIDEHYKDKNLTLGVMYTTSDQETINFATEIHAYLQSKGLKVTPVHMGVQGCGPVINGLCLLPKGIVVSSI